MCRPRISDDESRLQKPHNFTILLKRNILTYWKAWMHLLQKENQGSRYWKPSNSKWTAPSFVTRYPHGQIFTKQLTLKKVDLKSNSYMLFCRQSYWCASQYFQKLSPQKSAKEFFSMRSKKKVKLFPPLLCYSLTAKARDQVRNWHVYPLNSCRVGCHESAPNEKEPIFLESPRAWRWQYGLPMNFPSEPV